MNVVKKVRSIMVNAVHNFAKKDGVEPNEVQFFIHTKGKSEIDGGADIKYFYAINGKPVKKEGGGVVDISFLDILGKKLDIIGMGMIASQYLRTVFFENAKELDCEQEDLYIMLIPNKDADDVACCLYKEANAVKRQTLDDLFGSEGDKRE